MLFYHIFVINDAAFTDAYIPKHPFDPVHVSTLYDPEDCPETWSINPVPHVHSILPIKPSAAESGGCLKEPMNL